MKFKYIDDTEEEFTSPENKKAHYTKHIEKRKEFEYTPDEYEKAADKLSRTKIDNKMIFGYQSETRDGKTANCKYNKDTEEFVVYRIRKGQPETITMYRKSWREYTGDKAVEYHDEIQE